jgi:DNA-binding NarL/FixJ family response regulator
VARTVATIGRGDGDGGRPTRVLVAGGRQLGREGLRALLAAAPGVRVAGVARDEVAARAAVAAGGVDVVVTHVFLGTAGGGARLAVRLVDDAPQVGVVLLLGESDPREVRTVLDRGTARRALLLLDHPRCADDLLRAVADVAGGGSLVHGGVVDLLLAAEQEDGDAVHLTPREREVLVGIANGASNRRIAAAIDTSERAVEKHINQLYTKLEIPAVDGVHRRVLAARRALGLPPLTVTSGPSQPGVATAPPVDREPLAMV